MKVFFSLISIITLSFTPYIHGQSIQWSEEFKDRGYYSLIGESENAFFAERKYNTSTNDRDAYIELLRFDKELELTHVVEVKELEKGSYASIATINTPEGLAHIYYQTTKKGEHFISAQLFSHKALKKMEIVDLARFKISKGSQRIIKQDRDFQLTYPVDILLSRDKSKLAIMFDEEKVGKKKRNHYQYRVIDINSGFQILYEGDFYSDDQSKKYATSDVHLSNSGKLTYAIKKYVRNNSTEHINKKPAYDYEIYHMTGDTTEYIFDIKVRKEYLDKVTIGSDKEDNLYISGYLRKQPFGDIKKSFMLSLDHLGYERYKVNDEYSRRDVKEMVGKENSKLDLNFETIDIVPSDDIIYVVRQYRRRRTRNTDFNNTGFRRNRYNQQLNTREYYWSYDEVVIEGVGRETGEIQWTTVNPREQEDDDTYSRYFITGQIELVNNELLLIYNEREENLQKIRRKDNVKRTDIPGDKTAITIAKINSKGDIKYDILNEEQHYHLPENGVLIGNENIYYFNHHKNYSRFFVGKSNVSILDF